LGQLAGFETADVAPPLLLPKYLRAYQGCQFQHRAQIVTDIDSEALGWLALQNGILKSIGERTDRFLMRGFDIGQFLPFVVGRNGVR